MRIRSLNVRIFLISVLLLLTSVGNHLTKAECPPDGLTKVAAACMPLQGTMPSLLQLISEMAHIQEKNGTFSTPETTKLREDAVGFCKSGDALLSCLRLLQKCPDVLNMISGIAGGSRSPLNLPDLLNDGTDLLIAMCVRKQLSNYVDCIIRNGGINVRNEYCRDFNVPSIGDFSESFASVSVLMPGSKQALSGRQPMQLDCPQFALFSGCISSNLKRICNRDIADSIYLVLKIQGKTGKCQMAPKSDGAEAQYARYVPSGTTSRPTARPISRPPPPRQIQQTMEAPKFAPTMVKAAPCPADGLTQVMSKCLPLQSQLPALLTMAGDLSKIQDKTGSFTSAEIAQMKENASGVCKNNEAILGCLRLLQSCPNILGMIGSLGMSIKLPPNMPELINDSVGLLTTMCTNKVLSQFVDCIGKNNGVNIKQDYCGSFRGMTFGDFSASLSSFGSMLPGTKPAANTKPAAPLDCQQYKLFSGCMVSAIKKVCSRDISDGMYKTSQLQGKTSTPVCQIPASADAAEAEYQKGSSQSSGGRPSAPSVPAATAAPQRQGQQTAAPQRQGQQAPPQSQTEAPRVATTTAKIAPCPADGLTQVMSKCMPLQSQLPGLLKMAGDLAKIQDKSGSFTSAEIAQMKDNANGVCKSSDVTLGCLKLLQSCPSILGMVGSLGMNIKLPPNMPELINDGVSLLTTMCTNRVLSQFVDCIGRNNGVNIKQQYCGSYRDMTFGDFSASFSTFGSMIPGSKPATDSKPAAPLNCQQYKLFSGCMASAIKKVCSRDISDGMYKTSQVQGKTSTPVCQIPANPDDAEAAYLRTSPQAGQSQPSGAAQPSVPAATARPPSPTRAPQPQPQQAPAVTNAPRIPTTTAKVAPCPADGLTQVMSKCLPLQSQLPGLLSMAGELSKLQDKTGSFTSAEIAQMRDNASGVCKNSEVTLGCLRLLQSCPSILGMVGSLGMSIKLPPNMPELINDGVSLLTTMCTNRVLSQFVDCIGNNNGINIKQQYCGSFRGMTFGDFSASLSSFGSMLPGTKPAASTKPAAPLDCQQYKLFSGCMASAIKKVCNRDISDGMYKTSQVQGKTSTPVCQIPANPDDAEAAYLKASPQPAGQPSLPVATIAPAAPTRGQGPQAPAATQAPRFPTTTAKIAPCPADGLTQVMSKCLPLQSQLPTLLSMAGELSKLQEKTGSFTTLEIARMRDDVNGVCKNSEVTLGCLRLLQSCPNILGMVGSLGMSIKLPPNMPELINDGVSLLTTMCTNKVLSQFVECIGRNNGVNIKQQYCGSFTGMTFGDFSASFSSFGSMLPGSATPAPSSKPVAPLDCQQYKLFSGCMASAIKKVCNRDISDGMYKTSQVQGKTSTPVCQIPANPDDAEAAYLRTSPQSGGSAQFPATPIAVQMTTPYSRPNIINACPPDPFSKMMSVCMPIQSQLPSLLFMMAEQRRSENKAGSFSPSEIGKMRERGFNACKISDSMLSCLRLIQSCPSILSMIGSSGLDISLPPNMPELVDDGITLITTLCVDKGLQQFVDCIEMNGGTNIRYQHCSAFKGIPFGDFSSGFSSFSKLTPGGSGSSNSAAAPEPVDCRQLTLYAGCMYSSAKRMCSQNLADAMYKVSRIQGKSNNPRCNLPNSASAAEAQFLSNGGQGVAPGAPGFTTRRPCYRITTPSPCRRTTTANNGTACKPVIRPTMVPCVTPPDDNQYYATPQTTMEMQIDASPTLEPAATYPVFPLPWESSDGTTNFMVTADIGGSDEPLMMTALSTSNAGWMITTRRSITTTLSDAVAIPISLYDWSDEDDTARIAGSACSLVPPFWFITLVFASTLCLVLS